MRQATGEREGGSKTEISLKKDQWSRVEKRLIERRGGGRKEDKNGMEESMIEKERGGGRQDCGSSFIYKGVCY